MVYRALGIMSGSSLDGLDLAFVEFHEVAGKWTFHVKAATCSKYEDDWIAKLKNAVTLDGLHYQLLHAEYGHYIGEKVNRFIEEHELQYQVQLIASHGHTTFHLPGQKMTGQLGDGAAIAATTGINVVSDLRAMDIALGGQGAPIVPIGEKLLLGDYPLLLNLGGISNISFNNSEKHIAFDICPANRVLNMLAQEDGKEYDEGGAIAASGQIQNALLSRLNEQDYYKQPYPKSLANDFGTETLYQIIKDAKYELRDAMRTYVEHIALQIDNALQAAEEKSGISTKGLKLLVTGGGAHNSFLVTRMKEYLDKREIDLTIPSAELIDYKEAIIMALIGVLRWREENNVIASVTGATRDSIGGAMWIGQSA